MPRFKGQYENAIDEKGRLAIPAKMRRVLGPEADETFTATRGSERCIALYPLDDWERLEDELLAKNPFQPEARSVVRELARWAEDLPLDRQGRVVLPRRLMDFAGLDGQAIVIGMLSHIEVWAPEVWAAHEDGQSHRYAEFAQHVMN